MIEASFKVLKPVYLGDTLYAALEVADLKPQNTTGLLTMRATVHNQAGVLVMEGRHVYLLRKGGA
jgi:acyl dehydratase